MSLYVKAFFGCIAAGLIGAGLALATSGLPTRNPGEAKPYIEDGYSLPVMPKYLQGPTPFEPRFGCAWNRPGRNPFTGDTNSALAAVGVPPDSRVAAIRAIRAHAVSDRVRASKGSIQTVRYHERYNPNIGMTFGERTLCYATFPTFDHEEYGDLYIVDGFHIVIWDVCGNVSRVLPWDESQAYAESARPAVFPAVPRYAQPYYPGDDGAYRYGPDGYYGQGYGGRGRRGRGGAGGEDGSDVAYAVPEPETGILVLPFLLYLFFRKRK